MGKSALSTYTPLTQNNTRVNPLLQSTVLSNSKPPSNKKLMQSKTPQYNANSVGYETYLQNLGNRVGELDGKNANKVLIKTNKGKIFEATTISFGQFLIKLTNNETLPTKQDYINQHNAQLQKEVTTPASTPSDQDSLLNKDEEKNEEETKLKNKEESDNNEEPIADQGSLNTNDDTSETSTDTEESSQTEQEIYSSLINSQILAHSRGVSVLEQLKTSQIFATLKKSVSDQNLSPLPLSQSLLSSYVAPEGINLANSQLLERSLNQDNNKLLDEVKQNCKTILENTQQPDHFVKFVKNILGNKNFDNASSLDTSQPSELTTSKIENESWGAISQSQILLFKEVLAQYVINHFSDELTSGEENSECYKAYQALQSSPPDSIDITTAKNDKTNSVNSHIDLLSAKLIELHPKVAIAIFELCFPDANIVESWEQISPNKSLEDLWGELNTQKAKDLTLQEFFQEYFPDYSPSSDLLEKTLNQYLKQKSEKKSESSEEESEEQEESESSKNKKNEEIIQRLLPIIDNPIFTERLNSPNIFHLLDSDESSNSATPVKSATPIKSALLAAEATSFVQFLCLSIILLHPESDLPLPKNWTQYVQIENPINDNYLTEIANDKDGIEEFSKEILLLEPQIIIETFNNIFPDENIIESWHLLFPNFLIQELWQTDAFQKLTLEEFWDNIVSYGVKLDQAQEYKDLAMLKSATKSDIVNTDNQLDQSTCDNGLGTSQLPSPEELKDTFEAAIHQAGNQALAKKILQYNYPDDNSFHNPEDIQTNEEAVLSQDEAQFFRNFVCAMILKDNPGLAQKYLQNSQQECKNETQILPENQSILDLINLESINELADKIALERPRDVVQWFEMCFPNVHLPKAWEVVFPDSSIMTLWENKNQLAADTFSQFCQIVFPNYKVSEGNLDPAQKQNFDLFLNNDAEDTVAVVGEFDSVNVENSTTQEDSGESESSKKKNPAIEGKPSDGSSTHTHKQTNESFNQVTPDAPTTSTTSKGFFAAFFDSVSGFTSSILSSIESIFRSKNPTISEPDMTKTNSGGAENQETSTDEFIPTSTPKSQSFLSKIFGGMFESIGSFLGISGTTEGLGDTTDTSGNPENTLIKPIGDTNTETPDNV